MKSMEEKLFSNSLEDTFKFNKLVKAIDAIQAAANIFDKAGLNQESQAVTEIIRKLANKIAWKDQIPGGLADSKSPDDFDKKDLDKGMKVEMEHTDDSNLAKEIAMDHLTEDPKYYEKLEIMEKE